GPRPRSPATLPAWAPWEPRSKRCRGRSPHSPRFPEIPAPAFLREGWTHSYWHYGKITDACHQKSGRAGGLSPGLSNQSVITICQPGAYPPGSPHKKYLRNFLDLAALLYYDRLIFEGDVPLKPTVADQPAKPPGANALARHAKHCPPGQL